MVYYIIYVRNLYIYHSITIVDMWYIYIVDIWLP